MLALIQLFILPRSQVDTDTWVNIENAYKTSLGLVSHHPLPKFIFD